MTNDINISLMSMGHWKTKQIQKRSVKSITKSKLGKFYTAYPPLEGWKGGLPEHNGWKPSR